MSRDLFLESLQRQAVGNHGRHSVTGRRRIDEFQFFGDEQEAQRQQLPDMDMGMGGEEQPGFDMDMGGGGEEMPDLQMMGDMPTPDVPLEPAKLQMAAQGGFSPEPERPLAALRKQMQAKYMSDEGQGMAGDGTAGGKGTPQHLKQEVEQIHQQLTGLLHRLKGIMAQL